MSEPIEIKLRAGSDLFLEGDHSKTVYLIKSGKLEVYRATTRGTKQIAILQERQMVGVMAFFTSEPRSANVRAVEDSVLLELDTKSFAEYLNTQPVWLKIMIQTLVGHILEMNEKVTQS